MCAAPELGVFFHPASRVHGRAPRVATHSNDDMGATTQTHIHRPQHAKKSGHRAAAAETRETRGANARAHPNEAPRLTSRPRRARAPRSSTRTQSVPPAPTHRCTLVAAPAGAPLLHARPLRGMYSRHALPATLHLLRAPAAPWPSARRPLCRPLRLACALRPFARPSTDRRRLAPATASCVPPPRPRPLHASTPLSFPRTCVPTCAASPYSPLNPPRPPSTEPPYCGIIKIISTTHYPLPVM